MTKAQVFTDRSSSMNTIQANSARKLSFLSSCMPELDAVPALGEAEFCEESLREVGIPEIS